MPEVPVPSMASARLVSVFAAEVGSIGMSLAVLSPVMEVTKVYVVPSMMTVSPAVAFPDTVSVPVAATAGVLDAAVAAASRFMVNSTLVVAFGGLIWPLEI